MTKHDLVVRVSNKTGLAHAQAVQAVETVFEAIIESLGREERIELRNFGVFEVRRRQPRMGRNPAKPDKEYPVPARAVAKFKPGKEMKAIVGKLASAGEENSKSQNPKPN
jgi:DNA-binding protein HU-beta/integration host factor subunit alpha